MKMRTRNKLWAAAILAMSLGAAFLNGLPKESAITLAPSSLPSLGAVAERFQSFNVEMVEVTGGKFWKPYGSQPHASPAAPPAGASTSTDLVSMMPALLELRSPADLSNPRLRKLAAALGPAYMRVSGTWANSTYFHDSDAAAPPTPPEGFRGVLTRAQWKGVVDFSRAVDAKIVTSFAISSGTRDSAGLWTPKQAEDFLAYTKSIGGSVAAAEFMNEPTFATIGSAPKGYDAAAYARDFAVFQAFIKRAAPEILILGPGSVGEGGTLGPPMPGMIKSEDLLRATGPVFEAFSYHFYGAVSQRCTGAGAATTTAADALSEQWLSRTDHVEAYYAGLRDRFNPGKPLWLTETADAACGGNPWASTFLDSFRYLYQNGRLAQLGVQVVAHNTLAISDYGLIDEQSLAPRPNYWAAVLWRKFMGKTVLDPGPQPAPDLHVFAHCLRGRPGGVALLVINADRRLSHEMDLPMQSEGYSLTARDLLDSTVQLNGSTLRTAEDGSLPKIAGQEIPAGPVEFAPESITFVAIADARNPVCR